MSGQYYVRFRGKMMGPLSFGQLQQMRNQGQLSRFHEVSTDRVSWEPADKVHGLFEQPPEVGITSMPSREDWYYQMGGCKMGPVSREELEGLASNGTVNADTPVWKPGLPNWVPLAASGLRVANVGFQQGGPGNPPPFQPREFPQSSSRNPSSFQQGEFLQNDLRPDRGALILVFGILGLLGNCCFPLGIVALGLLGICFPLGIVAWIMGASDLNEMKFGRMDPSGKGLTQAGYILGIISTLINLIVIGLYCLIFGVAVNMNGRRF